MTPEKQEVDDLRSEVGSLRLQVVDMDGRIDALSRMVDRLLEERAMTGSEGGASGSKSSINRMMDVKHEIPSLVSPASEADNNCWSKKRRLDDVQQQWDECMSLDVNAPPGVNMKMEAGEEVNGVASSISTDNTHGLGAVQVKSELVYQFPGEATAPTGVEEEDRRQGAIVGGGALCRDSSFLRDLDNMSIGSVGSLGSMIAAGGSGLGSLDLIDVTGEVSVHMSGESGAPGGITGAGINADHNVGGDHETSTVTGMDMLNESMFELDFEAEITSMSSGSDDVGKEQSSVEETRSPGEGEVVTNNKHQSAALISAVGGDADDSAESVGQTDAARDNTSTAAEGDVVVVTAPVVPVPVDAGTVSPDQAARIEELTASLDSMPPESKFKLAEGLLALAQNPGVVSTFANNGGTAAAATGSGNSIHSGAIPTTSRIVAPEASTPEIALPLASAALGAFMVHYAQAQAVKEPAGVVAVAAAAMDPSRHALERTASLR